MRADYSNEHSLFVTDSFTRASNVQRLLEARRGAALDRRRLLHRSSWEVEPSTDAELASSAAKKTSARWTRAPQINVRGRPARRIRSTDLPSVYIVGL